jgi:hypothetical protein
MAENEGVVDVKVYEEKIVFFEGFHSKLTTREFMRYNAYFAIMALPNYTAYVIFVFNIL